MINTSSMDVTTNDKLITQWVKNCGDQEEKVYTQRKRLPKSTTKFTKNIQKIYLESGIFNVIKFINERTGFNSDDCLDLFDYARKKTVKSNKLDLFKSLIGY